MSDFLKAENFPPLFYNKLHKVKMEGSQIFISVYDEETEKWDKWLSLDEFMKLTQDQYEKEYHLSKK